MKIVMLCEFFNETLEYQENLLAKYYIKHGHQVTILTSTFTSVFDYYSDQHDNRWPAKEYETGGVKVIRFRFAFNLMNRLRRYTSIAVILEREQPDLIYIHDIMLNMLEAVAYKKRHAACKMIMDYHADYANSAKNWLSLKILHGVIRKWYLDRARKHFSKIFPIVPASMTFLQQVYKIPLEDMELLPLGADTDLGRDVRARGEGAIIRRQYHIPDDAFVMFTGGKLTPVKKTELLIEVFLGLADPALHLFVIGDSTAADKNYKAELVKLASGSPRIHFTGWLHSAEVYRYLEAANLAVFPASQSILWQQAISMHLPLVVGDTGGQDVSYLNPHGNIVTLPREEINVSGLRDVIRRLIVDRARLRQMGAGARQTTDELLNWDNLVHKTLRYNQLLTPPAGD